MTVQVTTYAGRGEAGRKNGSLQTAEFQEPTGLAVDRRNHQLFVAEYGGQSIRSVCMKTGNVSTLICGTDSDTRFDTCFSCAYDEHGRLFFTGQPTFQLSCRKH